MDFKLKKLYLFIFALILASVALLQNLLPYLLWGAADEFDWALRTYPVYVKYILWVFILPVILKLERSTLSINNSSKKNLTRIIHSFSISLFHQVLNTSLNVLIGVLVGIIILDNSFSYSLIDSFAVGLVSSVIEYWIIFVIMFALHNYNQNKENQLRLYKVESELNKAELKALKYQLNPHFIFNSLNSISALTIKDAKSAQDTITKFGDLLRKVLNDKNDLTTIHNELEFVKLHLEIEQLRFSDRLNVVYNIDNELLNYKVPKLILQPLVENSIKHAVSKNKYSTEIEITCAEAKGCIELKVEDRSEAVIEKTDSSDNFGVGQQNLIERLKYYYKENIDYEFKTTSNGYYSLIKILDDKQDD